MIPFPAPLVVKSTGIVLSDIIIRSAILQGLANLRAKPWLLKKYVFAGLPLDELTAQEYGQKTVDQATNWFLNQDIKVFLTVRQASATYPSISIELANSSEGETTLGDVNYQAYEDSDLQWPTLYGPFQVPAYNPLTGQMTIPDSPISLGLGMVVVDDQGDIHALTDILDDQTVITDTGITSTLNAVQLKGTPPALTASQEACQYRDTYQIGVHCGGEPEYTIWLHAIMQFILLSYKESLLEARGYERSTFSSSNLAFNEAIASSSGDIVFSRYITLTGFVRHQWPKTILPKITTVDTDLSVIPEAPSIVPIPIDEEDDGKTFW